MRSYLLAVVLFTTISIANASEDVERQQLIKSIQQHLSDDADDAETLIEQALVTSPDDAELQFWCGRVMGVQAQQAFLSALSYAKRSLACFQQAVALAPDKVDYRIGLMRFYLGAPSFAGGDPELAWLQVDAIKAISPIEGAKAELAYIRETASEDAHEKRFLEHLETFAQDPELQFQYGLLLQQKQEYAGAFAAFERAKALAIDDPVVFMSTIYQIGRSAVLSKTNIEQGIAALALYEQRYDGPNEYPEIEWALARRAQLHQLNGDLEQFEQYIEKAAKSTNQDLHDLLKTL